MEHGPDQYQLCTNCNREIPAANFMIHSAHCARNITICQRCKEPVPVAEMKRHTELVHCRQCGETMQACDVASHVTDACSQTPVQCQFCELLLCRQLMGDHELYCGTRTERCPECHEHVMIKYKRLHEDSNHGFIKLDDDPDPLPSWEADMPNRMNLLSDIKLTTFTPFHNQKNIHQPSNTVKVQEKFLPTPKIVSNVFQSPSSSSSNVLPAKRTNDMPQVNNVYQASSVFSKEPQKDILSKGAIKKSTVSVPSTSSSYLPLREKSVNVERSNKNYYDISNQDVNFSENFKSDKKIGKFGFTPMTPDELNDRLKKNNVGEASNNVFNPSPDNHQYESMDYSNWSVNNAPVQTAPPLDRFSEIKNELRVLRRELKDCSSPLENRRTPIKNIIPSLNESQGSSNSMFNQNKMIIDSPNRSNVERISEQLANFSINPASNHREVEFPEVVHCRACDSLVQLSELSSHERTCGYPQDLENQLETKRSSQHKKKKSHKKSKAPQKPLENLSSNPMDEMNSFMLPCEFCQNMIPASLLVEHERSCCLTVQNMDSSTQNAAPPNTPEGSTGSRHSITRNTQSITLENMEEARGFFDIEQDDVMLPCEFCMMPVSASDLMQHQESCFIDQC